MFKALKIVLVSVLGLGIGFVGGRMIKNSMMDKSDTTMAKPAEKFSPFVRLINQDSITVCSGTVVSDKYVVTAAHCLPGVINGIDRVKVLEENMKATQWTRVVAMNSYDDLLILEGDFRKYNHIKLNRTSNIKMGDKVTTVGFPRMGSIHRSTGTAQGYFNFFIMTKDTNLIPGMSGGALLNADNELIGVNSQVGADMQFYVQLINVNAMTGLGL